MDAARCQEVFQWAHGRDSTTIDMAVACLSDLVAETSRDQKHKVYQPYLKDIAVVLALSRTFLSRERACLLPARHLTWLINALRSIAKLIVVNEREKDHHEKYVLLNKLFVRTQQTRLLLEGTNVDGGDPVLCKGLFFYVNDASDDIVECAAAAAMRWNVPVTVYYLGQRGWETFVGNETSDSMELLLADRYFKWSEFLRLADDQTQQPQHSQSH